jgi:hypothetical protein
MPTNLHAIAASIRQRSPAWFKARQDLITASMIAHLLGFFLPSCMAKLGGAASSRADVDGCHAAYATLGKVPAADPATAAEVPHTAQLAMQWGTLHEPSALMAVACSLSKLAAALNPSTPPAHAVVATLAECGLHTVTQHPPPYTNKLPSVGASPDGVISVDGVMQAVVEAKCRFPFIDDAEHGYKYIAHKHFGKVRESQRLLR